MSTPIPILTIENLTFAYNGENVLQDVNLQIHPDDFIAMIGPNGGGKSTLLKLMLGLLEPDKGVIRVMGRPPLKAAPMVGYVPQDVHINRSFPITALDVVMMGLFSPGRRRRPGSADDRRKAMAALDHMGVTELAEARVGSLSGGQRQRVFIARALVTKPRLMLLDEPTANIDATGQASFFRLLKELNKEAAIVVVSHDLLVISRHVKSVACVNRYLHYHDHAEITGEMLDSMYPCTATGVCPVELVAHGLPHRVLQEHRENKR